MYTYDTLSAAVAGLKKRGFSLDFNLKENCLICSGTRFNIDDFEIVEVYRFEGDTDPADESVVYGVEGKNGQKGVLVSGYGPSAEGISAEMARKLTINRDE